MLAERSVATLAARNGTDMFASLRQRHNTEEQRFDNFLRRNASSFTEAHRQQVASAYAHVVQARAAAAAPAVPAVPHAAPAPRQCHPSW